MTSTIPARLARRAATSASPQEARQRAIQLYREWYRGAPEIVTMYAIPVSAQHVRRAIRRKFEENRYVSDQRVIDVLLLKGRQEYQETMNLWKQTDHVMGILLEETKRPQRTFLQKFYEGRDEDAVLPAATGLLK
ncbi:NADH-ubiquinone oxidoreductase Complex1 subunit [Fomitopsis betulina]|nr:NADH-ubiquinone oxidoreductase Complex1 subunit [Fomitopsis betulina]